MAKKKTSKPGKSSLDRKLVSLGKKWEKAMASQVKGAEAQLELANELYEIATESNDAELRIVEHRIDKPKSKPIVTTHKLNDPKAALHTMLRFCNVWLPMGQWICLQRGCPPWNPPGAPAGKFCFLIGCDINVCPTPGAAKTRCVYLCI
ncbi:MAG: hypothetical protein KZQ97_22320 [Candidatus Thiodiazotropha sp. (ex Dulcina madagascariensis)]|nr:hypothetical protein [Candidatus Thiodiazotropha sp. (ex Dulcina madagascariensis)]